MNSFISKIEITKELMYLKELKNQVYYIKKVSHISKKEADKFIKETTLMIELIEKVLKKLLINEKINNKQYNIIEKLVNDFIKNKVNHSTELNYILISSIVENSKNTIYN